MYINTARREGLLSRLSFLFPMEASAASDANLDTTRPAMGRFFCPPVPPACPPISLHSPATSRCLRGLLRSASGIFAPVTNKEITPQKAEPPQRPFTGP
nr:MAG TPA: hypothetical protein [Caudoviricetes sp.]